jgi:DNA topoisomerase-1
LIDAKLEKKPTDTSSNGKRKDLIENGRWGPSSRKAMFKIPKKKMIPNMRRRAERNFSDEVKKWITDQDPKAFAEKKKPAAKKATTAKKTTTTKKATTTKKPAAKK